MCLSLHTFLIAIDPVKRKAHFERYSYNKFKSKFNYIFLTQSEFWLIIVMYEINWVYL